jgi:hypothetical protein
MLFGDAKEILMDLYSKIDRRDESFNNLSFGIEMHKSPTKEDNFVGFYNNSLGIKVQKLEKLITAF